MLYGVSRVFSCRTATEDDAGRVLREITAEPCSKLQKHIMAVPSKSTAVRVNITAVPWRITAVPSRITAVSRHSRQTCRIVANTIKSVKNWRSTTVLHFSPQNPKSCVSTPPPGIDSCAIMQQQTCYIVLVGTQ